MSIPHGCRRGLQTPVVHSHHRWVCRKGTPCGTAHVSPGPFQWDLERSLGNDGTPLPIYKAELGQILLMIIFMQN